MNWEEHLTGVLRTQVDGLGGTEFQFIGMFMLICPVIDIYGIRNYKLPYSNISLIETLFYLSILSYELLLILGVYLTCSSRSQKMSY